MFWCHIPKIAIVSDVSQTDVNVTLPVIHEPTCQAGLGFVVEVGFRAALVIRDLVMGRWGFQAAWG